MNDVSRDQRGRTARTNKASVMIQSPERCSTRANTCCTILIIRSSVSPIFSCPFTSHLRSSCPWKWPGGCGGCFRPGNASERGSACCCKGDRVHRWRRRRCKRSEEVEMKVAMEEGWTIGGWGVNDPDSRDRTCVSPRTTDYEWATLWRSRSTNLMHVKERPRNSGSWMEREQNSVHMWSIRAWASKRASP